MSDTSIRSAFHWTFDECGKCHKKLDGNTFVYCEACTPTPEEMHRSRQQTKRRLEDESTEYFEQRRRASIQEGVASIPQRYRRFDLDLKAELLSHVARPGAIDEARSTMGDPMVVLVGVAGAGKTTLAAAVMGTIARRALDRDRDAERLAIGALWSSALRIAKARSGHALGQGDPPEIEHALSAPFMVLDDLGAEGIDAKSTVTEVIHARHDAELPTVITTGLPRVQIAARYGDGVARRLSEVTCCRVIRCDALKG